MEENCEIKYERLHGKIDTPEKREKFVANVRFIEDYAKKSGVSKEMGMYVWIRARFPDLTTRNGRKAYYWQWGQEMNMETN